VKRAADDVRFWNMRIGSIGSRAILTSKRMKTATPTTPPAIGAAIAGDFHGARVSPAVSPNKKALTEIAKRNAPSQSN
jgi:hypothetical protein